MDYVDIKTTPRFAGGDSNQSIVIVQEAGDLPGGCTLNVEGFTKDLKAGHIIVLDKNTGRYKPLKVEGDSYKPKETSEEYFGVLKRDTSIERADGAITTIGTVNASACPYPITADIIAGLPSIKFIYTSKDRG